MQLIWPNILPLVTVAHGTPNIVMALVIPAILQAMRFPLNPLFLLTSPLTHPSYHRGEEWRQIEFVQP